MVILAAAVAHKGLDMCTVAFFLKEWWYVYCEFGDFSEFGELAEFGEFCEFAEFGEFDDLA